MEILEFRKSIVSRMMVLVVFNIYDTKTNEFAVRKASDSPEFKLVEFELEQNIHVGIG